MANQGGDGSGHEAMDTDDHGKDTPSGNVPITYVYSDSGQSAPDREGIPTPSSSAGAGIYAGSSDTSLQSQSPDLKHIVSDIHESMSTIKEKYIAGQAKTGNDNVLSDESGQQEPIMEDQPKQENIQEQYEAPATDNVDKVDKVHSEALANSQTVDKGDGGVMTETESSSEFPAETDDNNVHNEPPHDDTYVFVGPGSDMSISGMSHIVSGQQGVVASGQPPSDTEEPLQLQLKVAHEEIARLKTKVERLTAQQYDLTAQRDDLTAQRDQLQSAKLQRLAVKKDQPNMHDQWKKTCDALRTELEQMEEECSRKCSLLEKDLKNSNDVHARNQQYYIALETRNVKIMQQLAEANEDLHTLRPTCQNYYQQAYNLQKANESAQKVCAKLNHEKTELATYNKQLVGELNNLEENQKLMSKENSNLVLRLSKVAGDRLTAGNPNIADLSDVHRPTKLAEDFSELYDNEWTDAFEEVPMETEKDKVKFLFNLLKRSYELCLAESGELFKHVLSQHASSVVHGVDQLEFTVPEHKNVAKSDISTKVQPERNDVDTKDDMGTVPDTVKQTARDRTNDIKSTTQSDDVSVSNDNSVNSGVAADDGDDVSMSAHDGTDMDKHLSDHHQHNESPSSLESDVDTGLSIVDSGHGGDAPAEKVRIGVSDESRKVLTDLYKHVIMAAADSVNKKLQRVIAQELQLDYTKQACIQTFVSKCLEVSWLMVMQTPTVHINFDSRSGEKLERDKYKAFTVMGKTIDYIVWPSVYLHEGGPLLTKGIAQGLRS